jgi:hypothetical protein
MTPERMPEHSSFLSSILGYARRELNRLVARRGHRKLDFQEDGRQAQAIQSSHGAGEEILRFPTKLLACRHARACYLAVGRWLRSRKDELNVGDGGDFGSGSQWTTLFSHLQPLSGRVTRDFSTFFLQIIASSGTGKLNQHPPKCGYHPIWS